MPFQITSSFQGIETVRILDSPKVAIGRASESDKPELDLSEDNCVSRQHALLELKNGVACLTDLGSRFGTQVNGREIRGQGECRLFSEDTVVLGQTRLRVEIIPASKPAPVPTAAPVPAAGASPRANLPPAPVSLSAPASLKPSPPPARPPPVRELQIVHTLETTRALAQAEREGATPAERRLKLLLDLPRQFSALSSTDELFQTVMKRVVEVIPAARRGALLRRNPQDDSLLLKAYVSADEPAVSETLARRAITEKRAFIWRATEGIDPSHSIHEFHILCGMYAPLQWQDQVFGVICVDSQVATDLFTEDDLQFLIAIGLYAGMALAEQQSLAASKRKDRLIDRLLANFSPKLRAVLLEQAYAGKLRPGGAKSEVTILFCDISRFTERAARMDAQDLVDMLNHYFQPIIEAIFRFDGTVDKFVGDAVLAVFGCPQADREQHLKAAKAALAIQDAVEATTRLRAARGDETCQVRVAVHSGEVFQGFVGANDRLEFTVIGDAVNRAHRYCDATGDGEVLISHEVFERVYNLVRAEKTRIQTKEGELEAYRLKGLRG